MNETTIGDVFRQWHENKLRGAQSKLRNTLAARERGELLQQIRGHQAAMKSLRKGGAI